MKNSSLLDQWYHMFLRFIVNDLLFFLEPSWTLGGGGDMAVQVCTFWSWEWGIRLGVGGTICQEEEIPSTHKEGFRSSVVLQRADALWTCALSGHACSRPGSLRYVQLTGKVSLNVNLGSPRNWTQRSTAPKSQAKAMSGLKYNPTTSPLHVVHTVCPPHLPPRFLGLGGSDKTPGYFLPI